MQNESNGSIFCAIAQAVVGDKGFPYLLALEILVGILAAVANCVLMILVWRVSVFHTNLRLLLSQLSFVLVWYSVGYVIKAISLLNHILTHADPCQLVTNAYECKVQEFPFTLPIGLTTITLLAINLERLYSTVMYRRYERGGCVPWMGCLLVILSWLTAVGMVIGQITTVPKDNLVAICENLLSMDAAGASRAFILSSVILITALICCVVGYLWNNYKLKQAAINRAQHTLASRFQIDQNVKVNKVMMPSMFIVTLSYLPNYAFLSIVISGLHLSHETQTWLVHVNYLWKLIYALAHALISFKRNTYLRQRMGKVDPLWTNPKLKRVQREIINEHQIHFTLLEEAWRIGARVAGIDQGRKSSKVSAIPTTRNLSKTRRDLDATYSSTTTGL